MEIIRKEYSFKSASGLADIFLRSWSPAEGAKAIFQITHGMAEHGERYEDMAKYLCEKGFVVAAQDHLGHKKSVNSDADLGYFGEKNGWSTLVEDTRQVTEILKTEYPDLPLIFFGHSMGSFIGREYIARYGNDEAIKGAVICGTSGKNPASGIAIHLANIVAKMKGSKHKSEFINKIAFGPYNNKISNPKTPFDWLSTDEAQVEKYIADKYCGFLFTALGYRDLFTIITRVSTENWFKSVKKDLPLLIIAGEEDPVGAYGKGVKQVYNLLKEQGCKDLTLKLYPGMRHEIHNEKDNITVYQDIAAWALSKI